MNALRASILLYRYGPFYIANWFFLMHALCKWLVVWTIGKQHRSITSCLCGPTPSECASSPSEAKNEYMWKKVYVFQS